MSIAGLDSRFASTPGYADLVKRFKKSLADDLAFLRAAEAGPEVAKRVHRIKGAAYMLGFDLLGDLAANSERDEDQLPGLLLALELLATESEEASEGGHTGPGGRVASRENPENSI